MSHELPAAPGPRCVVQHKQRERLLPPKFAVRSQDADLNRETQIAKEKDLGKLGQPAEINILDTVKAEMALSNARASLYAAQRADRLSRAEVEV